MMYRILAIVAGALALGACSSSSDWLDGLKPGPSLDTVRFESEPPGAEAKTSNGQTCRTPCALALPTDAPLTVTFSLTGYQPESETIEPITQTAAPPQMRPNPVLVELTPAPPPPKPAAKRKPAPKSAAKPAAAKPAAKPAAPRATAPAPMAPSADQQPAPAPWPAPPRQ
jgi:outer membrane biosynthesis protein TonB